MDITSLVNSERVVTLKADSKENALKALVKVLAKTKQVTNEKEPAKAISDR